MVWNRFIQLRFFGDFTAFSQVPTPPDFYFDSETSNKFTEFKKWATWVWIQKLFDLVRAAEIRRIGNISSVYLYKSRFWPCISHLFSSNFIHHCCNKLFVLYVNRWAYQRVWVWTWLYQVWWMPTTCSCSSPHIQLSHHWSGSATWWTSATRKQDAYLTYRHPLKVWQDDRGIHKFGRPNIRVWIFLNIDKEIIKWGFYCGTY